MKTIFIHSLFLIALVLCHGTSNAGLSDELLAIDALQIDDIRSAILSAKEHGLNANDYWNKNLENQYLSNPSDPRLIYQARVSYIKLLKHLNSGTVNPELLGKYYLLKKRQFLTTSELSRLTSASGNNARGLLSKVAPRTPHYRSLQEALKRMTQMCDQGDWTTIPTLKRTLKLGDRDSIISEIKYRLWQFGYNIQNQDDIFDQSTLNAVNNIQVILHMRPDGIISPGGRTLKYLNVSCEERITQMEADLEKLRWLPREFGDRYIFVNLAHNYLTLIDRADQRAQTMKVIEGRPTRQTPTLVDKITYITINPFWVVPPTVFKEDKLTDLKGLTPRQVQKYFEDNKYEVWDQSFKAKLDPGSIKWDFVDSKTGIYIRQKPGLHNALGVLKFNLTNGEAIYLHDTNQRNLFSEYERQLSSGCVRVERPFDLAEYLLRGTKYSRQEIEAKVAKPGEIPLKDENVSTPNPIPVYMVFQTTTFNSDMVMRFAEDHYDQAAQIRAAKTFENAFDFEGLF